MRRLRGWIRKRLEAWAWSLVEDRVHEIAGNGAAVALDLADSNARLMVAAERRSTHDLVELEHAYAKTVLAHAMARDDAIVNGTKLGGTIFPPVPPTLH